MSPLHLFLFEKKANMALSAAPLFRYIFFIFFLGFSFQRLIVINGPFSPFLSVDFLLARAARIRNDDTAIVRFDVVRFFLFSSREQSLVRRSFVRSSMRSTQYAPRVFSFKRFNGGSVIAIATKQPAVASHECFLRWKRIETILTI